MSTITIQRVEGLAVAIAASAALVSLGHAWWWLLALFLVFDLSAMPYLFNARAGAASYNAIHSWTLPALLAIWTITSGSDRLEIVTLAWLFHIGLDRALGYGLKEPAGFRVTHLTPGSS